MWHHTEAGGLAATKYLVDSTGTPQFLVDPGINGVHKFTATGKAAPKKFGAYANSSSNPKIPPVAPSAMPQFSRLSSQRVSA